MRIAAIRKIAMTIVNISRGALAVEIDVMLHLAAKVTSSFGITCVSMNASNDPY